MTRVSAYVNDRTPIEQVRALLDGLVALRLEHPWTAAEGAEYAELIAHEKRYLADNKALTSEP